MKVCSNLFRAILFCSSVLLFSSDALRPQSVKSVERAGRMGAIDESQLVTLRGNHHPVPSSAADLGEVPAGLAMERMLLVLSREPALERELQQLLASQQDKSSPNFHAWLSPAEFGQRYGAASDDLQQITSWLQSHGFRVNRVSAGRMAIEFSGTAAQVKETFHTAIHAYSVAGETRYANASDPQIPAALASVVSGINTLHSFRKQPASHVAGQAHRVGDSSLWRPDFTFAGGTGPEHFLAPGDFAKIYNTAPLYQGGIDGSGESIAIVARNNINLSDVQIFRIAFGLPVNDPQIILDGPDPGNAGGSEETEADLDIEWSGAIAPKATIKFVVSASTNTTDGVDLSALYIVDNNLAPVLSASFGECEQSLGQAENSFFNNLWEQAAAQGITVVISSGDNGPAGCDNPNQTTPASQGLAVSGLASTPFNIAVGGTMFNENGADSTYWAATNGPGQVSVLGYIPENVWNESCADPNQCGFASLFASSGGVSTLYAKPSWQAGSGVPNDGKRDLPDVSLDAAGEHDAYLLCQEGVCTTNASGQLINAELVGGTSASTPTFAAIMALIVQKTSSRQGQANFVLYPLVAGQNAANCNASGPPQSSCLFNDVTQGNNNVPGQAGAVAGIGYDLATGWGSVNAANLAASWRNETFAGTNTTLQLSSTSFTHGQPVTATVSVSPTSGSGTPTGDIALLAAGAQGINLGNLTSGAISGTVATLPGGSYPLTASYGGDGKFGASLSSPVSVTVTPEASTTTFSAALNGVSSNSVNSTYGAFLAFQVNVSGASQQGAPSGTLTFSDTFNGSTSTILTSSLNSKGGASIFETQLALGTHTVNVNYSGDASFNASSAGPVTVTVAKGPTQTVLLAPVGALPNTSLEIEAIVLPNGAIDPTGTVQFFDGKNVLGNPIQVKNLVANFTTSQLSTGSHVITGSYSGDPNFLPSTSGALTVVIGNPDFIIGVNPGNVVIASGSSSGTTNVQLTPGPGVPLVGPVALTCSGLPAGSTCTFQNPSPVLNGFTPLSIPLNISKPSAQSAALRQMPGLRGRLLNSRQVTASLAGFGFVFAVLILWPAKRRLIPVLLCLSGACVAINGCGHAAGVTPPGTTVSSSFVVTVNASGGSGGQAVSHNVTVQVTVQ